MKTKLMLAVGAGLAGVAAALPAPAHADEASFLEHVAPRPDLAATAVAKGHQICDSIRAGLAPESVPITTETLRLGPGIVGISQHHLCPDTLNMGPH